MSAADALKAAHAAGIQLGVDGEDLVLDGVRAAASCRARSPGAVTRPRSWRCCGPAEDGWSAEDWQVFFDERAGIVEFDGGTAAGGGRGPGLRLLRRRVAEPQSGALAGRALFRMW